MHGTTWRAVFVATVLAACASNHGATAAPATQRPPPEASASASAAAATSPRASATSTARPTTMAGPSATATQPAPLSWRRLAAEGPAAREDHTWTVDESRASAWLFGGRDGTAEFDDLWRYDLAADRWHRVETDGPAPSARFGHAAAWLPGVGLVVWAGQAGTSFFADLWAFDARAGTWRQLASTGDVPPARYGSCLALGPDGRLWISHGFTADAGRFGDTRAWDPATGEWADETPRDGTPVVRCLHDCLWTPDGRLVLYGGQTTGVAAIGDLWTLERGTWRRAPEPQPAPRQLYALAQRGDAAWVFGGGDVDRQPLGDLWRLDFEGLSWSSVAPDGERPAARIGAALVSDDERGRLLLWGGHDGDAAFADLWALPLP